MPEPASAASAATLVAAISTVTLALFGVDYYSVLYGFLGSLMAMLQGPPMGRFRAVLYVALSTLIGAALGNAALAFVGSTSRPLLILACVVGSAGSQKLIGRLLWVAEQKLTKLGGGS